MQKIKNLDKKKIKITLSFSTFKLELIKFCKKSFYITTLSS